MSDQHDFSPVRALDENGLPVPGAQAFFYIPGTTALRDVFADDAETILHPSPLLSNSAGVFPAIWCSQLVKCTVLSPSGVTLSGYPMQIAMRSFGGVSGAAQVTFAPTANIAAQNVQDAIELVKTQLAADIAVLQPADADLTALAALATTGFIARTAAGAVATRALTAGAGIAVTNSDGVAGNPTIASLGLGIAQSWQDVTASRALTTVYTNSTSAPIEVSAICSFGNVTGFTEFYVGSLRLARHGSNPDDTNMDQTVGATVPAGQTYRVLSNGVLTAWSELRA